MATAAQMTPLTGSCNCSGTSLAALHVPMSPPAVAPRLQMACSELMIERPRHCSTITPCTFCAESMIASNKPPMSSTAPKTSAVGAKPAADRTIASSTEPVAVTARAPNPRMIGAAAAAARIAPTGKQMTSRPNAVLLSAKACFTSG